MLTRTEIINAIKSPPNGMTAGKLQHLRQRERQGAIGTSKSATFLDDMLDRPVARPVTTYNHPARGMAVGAASARRGDGPLSPAEIAWLGTIPTDPSQVPYDDATALAGIADAVSTMQHPADARLVAAKLNPVRDFHDRNQADADLVNARQTPVPVVPSSALPAMAEAIRAETPTLTEAEAIGRARDEIAKAAEAQRVSRDDAVNTARDRIDELDRRIADRKSAVR